MFAAQHGDLLSVNALLEAGAGVTALDKHGNTAMHLVGVDRDTGECFDDDSRESEMPLDELEEVFNLLVKAGGDAHAPDDYNYTPLELAVDWYTTGIRVNNSTASCVAKGKAALRALIVGAAAEMRRLERARAEQEQREHQRELKWARREAALAQRVAECEQRERELSKRQRLA